MEKQIRDRVLSIALSFAIVFSMAGIATIGIDLSQKGNSKALRQNRNITVADGKEYETVKPVLNGDFENASLVLPSPGDNDQNVIGKEGWALINTRAGQEAYFEGALASHTTTNPITGTGSLRLYSPTAISYGNYPVKHIDGTNTRISAETTAISFKVKTTKKIVATLSIYDFATGKGSYQCEGLAIPGSPDVQTIVVPFSDLNRKIKENGVVTGTVNIKDSEGVNFATVNNAFLKLVIDSTTSDGQEIILDDFIELKEVTPKWTDVANIEYGNFEDATCVGGGENNSAGISAWAAEVNQVNDPVNTGGYPGSLVERITTNAISGTASLRFYSPDLISWGSKIRKHFDAASTRFKAETTAISFKVKTAKTVGLGLSLYNTSTFGVGSDYQVAQKTITGSADVQTVVIPLSDFKNGNISINGTGGVNLQTVANLVFKMEVYSTVAGENEVIFDDFKEVKPATIKTQYTASVISAGNGTATVNGKSSITVDEGTEISCVATPAAGYIFDAWYIGDTKLANFNPLVLNLTANLSVTAKFIKDPNAPVQQYTASVKTDGNGTATVNGKATITADVNTQMTYSATPKAGYIFDGWYINMGAILGDMKVNSDNPFVGPLTSNLALTAKFIADPNIEVPESPKEEWVEAKKITKGDFEADDALKGLNSAGESTWAKSTTGAPTGTVIERTKTNPIAGTASMRFYSPTTLDWNAPVRHQFDTISGSNFEENSKGIRFDIKTEKDVSVDLNFYDPHHEGATETNLFQYIKVLNVKGSPDVQTFTVPLKEFILDKGTTNIIQEMGARLFNESMLTFRMYVNASGTENEVLFDNFIIVKEPPAKRTITLVAEEGGTVTGGGAISEGSTTIIKAIANEGYSFEGWYLDGNKVSSLDTYEITIAGDATYTAKFEKEKEPEVPVEPEGQKGFKPAFDPTAENVFSLPTVGTIAVDPTVLLNEAKAVKWSYDFTTDSASDFKNKTSIENVKLRGNAFGILVKTESDLILNVNLKGKKGLQLNYEQTITGSATEQLVSFNNTEIVYQGTNAAFSQLDPSTIKMTLTLKKPTTTRAVANTGDVYFNNISEITYNPMIEKNEGGDEVLQYTIKVSKSGNGTVTGGGTFDEGSDVQLEAKADAGYTFSGWYLNDEKVSTKAKYDIRVKGDAEYVAKFIAKTPGNGNNNEDENGNGTGNTDNTKAPETGDATPLLLLITLIATTTVLGTIVVVAKKKANK